MSSASRTRVVDLGSSSEDEPMDELAQELLKAQGDVASAQQSMALAVVAHEGDHDPEKDVGPEKDDEPEKGHIVLAQPRRTAAKSKAEPPSACLHSGPQEPTGKAAWLSADTSLYNRVYYRLGRRQES